MRLRTARGHERLQIAAGALGQRTDANGQENLAKSFPGGCTVARKSRSLFSPHGQHQLSAYDCALHDAAAGDDRALSARLVPGAVGRPAALSGVHVLDFELLPGCAKGTAAKNMVAHIPLHAFRNGHRHRYFRAQRASGDRSYRGEAN